MNKTDIEIIDEVIEIVEHNHAQVGLAYNSAGRDVHPNSPTACSWCLLGAIAKAQPDKYKYDPVEPDGCEIYPIMETDPLVETLASAIAGRDVLQDELVRQSVNEIVYGFNDDRSAEEVVEFLKKFRKQLEKK